MPDCTYCDETFADDESYLAHLRDAHGGELSRIDRRRVESIASGADGSRLLVYGGVAVGVLLIAAVVYVTTLSGGNDAPLEARPLPDHGDEALLEDVEQFPSEGNVHLSQGTEIDYSTSPPTSGPHYPQPAEPGFHDEPVPPGNLVHSLEHGAVVVYYDPAALAAADEESLRAFARNHQDPWAAVIVVPNPDEDPDSPYVLTAWRKMLRVDGYDPATVRAFVAEYVGRGPENPVRPT